MGVEDGAAILGMVLRADVPAVVAQLDDLGESALGIHASDGHTRLLEALAVLVVELKAVAVALLDVRHTVCLCNLRARFHTASVCAQAHRAAHVGDRLLVLHQVDDVV